MNEKELGNKIASILQSGLNDIDDATCAKLKGTRRLALEQYQEKVPVAGLAWAGAFLNGRLGNMFGERSLLWAPLLAALLALGISGYFQYWQSEGDDVDAFLLAGDLPIRAYIDKDFDTWLKGYSR